MNETTPKFPHPDDSTIVAELEKLEIELKSTESHLLQLIDRQQQLDKLNSVKAKEAKEAKTGESSLNATSTIDLADSDIGLLVARELLRSNFDNYFVQEMQKWDDSLASAGFGIGSSTTSSTTTAEDAKNEKRALFFDEMERHICAGLRDLRKTFVYDCY